MGFVLIVEFAELEVDQGFLCARQAILTLSHPTLCLCLVDCGFVVFICWLVGLLLFVSLFVFWGRSGCYFVLMQCLLV